MRRGWQVACICLLGVFLAALATSLDYSLTDALGPGPGFFPFWLSLIGIALTVAILAQIARGQGPADATVIVLPDRRAASQAGLVLAALIVGAVLLEALGFRLTMLLFIASLLFALGARSAVAISLTALAGSFGVFHAFYYWLKVPLPIGAFGL
jgi:putative tricarboxylic transport membrane protein